MKKKIYDRSRRRDKMHVMYFSFLRPIAAVVLVFFMWTFGGVFDIAYAAKNDIEKSAERETTKTKKPAEKFNKALEDIEETLKDTALDTNTKKSKLKANKKEIEDLDIEIRKQFKETEDKIQNLPEEIKKRHSDFVKHYEDNLNELRANLDDIDKETDEEQLKAKLEKATKHLEKVKPPKKHRPLDPNKLPHRAAPEVDVPLKEISEVQAKLLDKEFAEIYSGSSSTQHSELGTQNFVQLASSGSLEGMLPQAVYVSVDLPTADDLAETIEVQFTEDIQAKAAELENNPVKIYNWVRNNIEFVPTYGSIQGADYCMQTKLCNAFDTASLLIALLRASGIHARYVQGTVELPIEKVMNWVGGFSDPNSALSFIASGGIPVGGLTSGGKIISAQIDHVWVEAWIDYFPSRGARHKTGQGDLWVRMDTSFKQYNITDGIDIQSALPFDAQTFVEQIIASATINEVEGYITGVDSSFIEQTIDDYKMQVENYMTQNYPDATSEDVLGKKEIIKKEFPFIPGTLPFRLIAKLGIYSDLPDNLRHKLTFNVSSNNPLYDTEPLVAIKALPELAGKKITLSYSPTTQADADTINSFLPEPQPDGTPINPSELPNSLPAYLINLKPELRVDAEIIGTGGSVVMGLTENFIMKFSYPGQSDSIISNLIEAGEYLGIVVDLGQLSDEQLLAVRTKLLSTKIKLQTNDITTLTKNDIVGDLLYLTALTYYEELDLMNEILSKILKVNISRLPSENIFSFELDVATSFYDVPLSVSLSALAMDVDYNIHATKSLNGDLEKSRQFMLTSGKISSILEHSVPEQLFSTPENAVEGISAIKALKIANSQGMPIYTINHTNIGTTLPLLQVDSAVLTDIQNAVNAGKEVTISKTNIDFHGWVGCGYIITDPKTGAGAYMISGGTNGSILILILLFPFMLISLLSASEAAAEPYEETYANISKKDPQCLLGVASKCGKDAVEDAMWSLYLPVNLIIDTLCLVIIRDLRVCAGLAVFIILISLGHMVYKLETCKAAEIEKCPDVEPLPL
jgi:transglutaminase-like putative cysteine protease